MREEGLSDYLVLLSVYQTCKYRGVSFLKFLLSREEDVEAFCERRRKKKRASRPRGLPGRLLPDAPQDEGGPADRERDTVMARVLFLHGSQASPSAARRGGCSPASEREWFHDAVEAAKQSHDICQADMDVGSSMGGWSS